MSRKLVLFVLIIVAFGSVATLISGFYKQDLSHALGVSITGYGFPLSWYKESVIIYPHMPTHYSFSWESFALDISFWSLTIGAIIVALKLYRARK